MPICGAPRTRKRGGQEYCQRPVPKEGMRCSHHNEEALLRKEIAAEEKAARQEDQQDDQIADIDASSIDELSKKLNLEMELVRVMERVLRDPDDSEGQDLYISLGRRNLVRAQMIVEANPSNLSAIAHVGNLIGQLKLNEKREAETGIRRLELARLEREAQAVSSASTDVLSKMMQVNQSLEDGFYKEDPSPRRSVDAYADWLGENITVEQVLAGEAEHATAPWEMQREILQALFWPAEEPINKPDCRHVICVTGNNTGKSYISARCVLFNTYFLYPSITIVTGPRLSQVRDTVSAEVRRKHNEMDLPGKANVLRLQPNPEFDRAYVNFTSAQTEDAFQGHHGRILLILEEASGIAGHIYDGTLGIMSGGDCRMLEIGNMLRRRGRFFDNYSRAEKNPDDPKTYLVQRGAHDHPNYIHRKFIKERGGKDIYLHALSAEWADEMRELYGEESPYFRVKVLGLPPRHDSSMMLDLHYVDESTKYYYEPNLEENPEAEEFEVAAEVIFADIAGMGDNQTVIGNWQLGKHGHRVRIEHVYGVSDHSLIADKMYNTPTRRINDDVFFTCDTNGEGSGILEMLIERGVEREYTRGFKSHSDPEVEVKHKQQEQYADLETECWARMRDWLRASYNSMMREHKAKPEQVRRRIDLPGDGEKFSHQLVRELTGRGVELDGEVIKLQPKKEFMDQLGGDSPDFSEAVIIGSRMVWIALEEYLDFDD